MIGDARFSACRTYRWTLSRTWDDGPTLQVVGLNPSTADEVHNDPTVTRCIRYAQRWGYGRLLMTNAYGLRSTDPRGLREVADPVGPRNDHWIRRCATEADRVLIAWGNHGTERAPRLLRLLDEVWCLGITKTGQPKHPLYLRADLEPVPYDRGSIEVRQASRSLTT